MEKQVKDAWVAALCSGKYKQTRGALCNQSGMCCLGVLLEINGMLDSEFSVNGFRADINDETQIGFPGEASCDILGLNEFFAIELAEANDLGDNFDVIANMIEARIE